LASNTDIPVAEASASGEEGTAVRSRLKRSDAQRNVAALLLAAKSVFATTGVDAPAKEITDAAGVGVGTLYRHFPRRSDLIVAVLEHEIDECVRAMVEISTTPDPVRALAGWTEPFLALLSTKQGLSSVLHSGDPAYTGLLSRLLERLVPAMRSILDRAVAAGVARGDVSALEVLLAVILISQSVPGQDASFNERMVRVFVDGLKPASPNPT
jgi:AcrR family transcriptional regulator